MASSLVRLVQFAETQLQAWRSATPDTMGQSLGGLYCYGTHWVQFRTHLRHEWLRSCRLQAVEMNASVHRVHGAGVTRAAVWRASGHLAVFSDPIVKSLMDPNKMCRVDHLKPLTIEKSSQNNAIFRISFKSSKDASDWLSKFVLLCKSKDYHWQETGLKMVESTIEFPVKESLSHNEFLKRFDLNLSNILAFPDNNDPFISTPEAMPLMFHCLEQEAFLRPETTQSALTQSLYLPTSTKPFLLLQTGRAWRNEVQVAHGPYRTREFDQMESQLLLNEDDKETFDRWVQLRLEFWKRFMRNSSSLQLYEQSSEDRAHYAKACIDIEYKMDDKSFEWEGVAHRSDYDTKCHQWSQPRQLMEASAGLSRVSLFLLHDALVTVKDKEVCQFHPHLAPWTVAVCPLYPKKHSNVSFEIYRNLWLHGWKVLHCEDKSMGYRYAQLDQWGVVFVVVVDQVQDSVTVRYRNTAVSERIAVKDLLDYLADKWHSFDE